MCKIIGAGGSPVEVGKVIKILGGRTAGQMMNYTHKFSMITILPLGERRLRIQTNCSAS